MVYMERARRVLLALVATVVVTSSLGCATHYVTQYYRFSGTVVDDQTGSPVANALVVLADSEENLSAASEPYPRPWNIVDMTGTRAVSQAEMAFGRPGINRRIILYADDDGTFSTIWRHDRVIPYFLFIPFKSASMGSVTVLARDPNRRWTISAGTGPFSGGPILEQPLADNHLGTVVLAEQSEAPPVLGPLAIELMMTRLPMGPTGDAADSASRAQVLFDMERYVEAIRLSEESLDIEPDNALMLMLQVDALFRDGQIDLAIEKGEQFINRFPNYGVVHKIIADAYRQRGDEAKFKRHLIQAMQLDPEFLPAITLFEKEYIRPKPKATE